MCVWPGIFQAKRHWRDDPRRMAGNGLDTVQLRVVWAWVEARRGERRWQWQRPAEAAKNVVCFDRGFRVKHGDATLQVTFAHPAKVAFVRPDEGLRALP